MSRRVSITSSAFEGLIRNLPPYVDAIVTADAPGPKAKKYLQLDDVTYIAPLDEAVAS